MNRLESGALYVVATPIGHLSDITLRALEVLKSVDCIAAEDTRHTKKLLSFHGLSNSLLAFHEHNETRVAAALLDRCEAGGSVALVSDAGTPLVSDPGQNVIEKAHERGVRVIPIPGCCAALAALSVAGLPVERFVFEGFLPARPARRKKRLQSLSEETRVMIFYEAVHRMPQFLDELIASLGGYRLACVARELTKQFETITRLPLVELKAYFGLHPDQLRGEFVVLVEGQKSSLEKEVAVVSSDVVLRCLLGEMSPSKAAAMAAKITGEKKNKLYAKAIQMQSSS